MNIATDAPKRPALRYYGGKWNLAPWIISHFPPHKNYVEPCGGAASVLLQKPRSPLETYNDLDGNVVNFFRVLRDKPEELIRQIELTPWSRDEFEICRNPSTEPLENARRFYVSATMGMGRSPFDKTTSPRFVTDCRLMYSLTSVQISYKTIVHLYGIAERLNAVQIENDDCVKIIQRFDNDGSLIYFDPPYAMSTRTGGAGYHEYEFSDLDHIKASEVLKQCFGYVIVNGYSCQLYTDLYESYGWRRVDKEAQVSGGGKRIESLWLSPRTWNALQNDYSDLGLFAST
jgi:DNA adenine methylase